MTPSDPDVAANGGPILISAKGYDEVLIGGTSASAPIFAGILTRINDARLAAGMPTIGFVNPTLVSSCFLSVTIYSRRPVLSASSPLPIGIFTYRCA